MNTDKEQTHTVGHLDPPRNISGSLKKHLISWRPFGTTHEISGRKKNEGDNPSNLYCLQSESGANPASAGSGADTTSPKEKPNSLFSCCGRQHLRLRSVDGVALPRPRGDQEP